MSKSDAERAETAINSRDTALLERNLVVRALIAQTGWPAHLEPLTKANALFPYALCLHSPVGHLTWLLGDRDLELFQDLPITPQGCPESPTRAERLQRLSALGVLPKAAQAPSGPLASLMQKFNAPTVARLEREAAIWLGTKPKGRYYVLVRDDGRAVELERVGRRKPMPRAGWFYAATLEKQG